LPDGRTGVPNLNFPEAPNLCTAYTLQNLTQILPVALEQDVSMILSDLADTITQPDRIPINCGRAVETVRAMIDPNPNRKVAWASLQSSLNLTQSYLEFVTAPSKAHRHGDYAEVDSRDGDEIRNRAWTIMNRFFEFRKRNNQPLPIAQFPLLE
jgi:hypothetical protein